MLSFCLRALVILLAVLASGRAAGPPSFDYFEFRPAALSANSPAQVLFAVRVNGDPSQVSLVPTGLGLTTPVALRDDGQGGDETAGDRIYSLLASTAPILDVRRADDVNRVFVGFLDLYDGVARVARANIFVDVYTPDVGEFELTTLSASVQATATLVNIQADLLTSDLPSITREFYRWFPDDYDFLNIVYMPGGSAIGRTSPCATTWMASASRASTTRLTTAAPVVCWASRSPRLPRSSTPRRAGTIMSSHINGSTIWTSRRWRRGFRTGRTPAWLEASWARASAAAAGRVNPSLSST